MSTWKVFFVCSVDVPKEPKNLEVVNTDASSVAICWQPPEKDGGSPLINYVIEMRSAKETKYKVTNSLIIHLLRGSQ